MVELGGAVWFLDMVVLIFVDEGVEERQFESADYRWFMTSCGFKFICDTVLDVNFVFNTLVVQLILRYIRLLLLDP